MSYIKTVFAAVSAFVLARLGILAPWAGVLIIAMLLDYSTGMAAGWLTHTLNSRTGIIGIVKKLGYIVLVVVAIGVDWTILQAGGYVGITIQAEGFVALLVIMWLLVNEAISILENLGRVGVTYPEWFMRLLQHLQQNAEAKGQEVLPK